MRSANHARREQAAVTVIETAALSENSARFLELLSEIPDGASAAVIENLDADTRRQIFLFGLRVEVIGYMDAAAVVVSTIAADSAVGDRQRSVVVRSWRARRRRPRRTQEGSQYVWLCATSSRHPAF